MKTTLRQSRVRDQQYLLLKRTLTSSDPKDRPKISLPEWLGDLLDFDIGIDAETHRGWTEFMLMPGDGAEPVTYYTGTGGSKTGAQVRFGHTLDNKLPYGTGDTLVLDVDLHAPTTGVLVRPLADHEHDKFGNTLPRKRVERLLDTD